MQTIVVVAQKAVARFFSHEKAGEPLEEISALEHPQSALKNRALTTDGSGSVRERMGASVREAQPEQLPKEREAENFAREVAARMRELRLSNDYHRAVVVAAPQFLGMLRDSLSDADRAFVDEEIAKNVATHDLAAIEQQLDGVLRIG